MKTKTVIGVAVASALTWAAAAHAGPGHQASWVAAGEEQYPAMVMFEGQPSQTIAMDSTPSAPSYRESRTDRIDRRASASSVGGTSARAGGSLGGSFAGQDMTSRKSGHGTPWIVSGEEIYPPMMMSDGARSPELAANEGIYTEHYLVTLTPMTSSEWDAYVISQNPESAEFIVLLDDPDYILTTYDVILLPSDYVESSERLNARREEPAA